MSSIMPNAEELKKMMKLAKKNAKREEQGKPPVTPKPDGISRKAWREMQKGKPPIMY